MSTWQIVAIVVLLGLFIFAKAWVFKHPKSMIAIVIGAGLLIFSEPATAG
jgi:hypothetical protein